jgi:hypothetical protein
VDVGLAGLSQGWGVRFERRSEAEERAEAERERAREREEEREREMRRGQAGVNIKATIGSKYTPGSKAGAKGGGASSETKEREQDAGAASRNGGDSRDGGYEGDGGDGGEVRADRNDGVLRVVLEVPPSVFNALPPVMRKRGHVVRVVALLFTQGVNEHQQIANKLHLR